MFIYFGRPTCHDCITFSPELFEIINEKKKKIYYFNTDRWRNNADFHIVTDKYGIKTVPALIKVNEDNFDIIYSNQENSDWTLKLN